MTVEDALAISAELYRDGGPAEERLRAKCRWEGRDCIPETGQV